MNDNLFALTDEAIPSVKDGLPQKGEWTNVLFGRTPIQATEIERISWIV